MNLRNTLALVATLVLLFASPAIAQDTGAISGRVFNVATGNAVANARIQLDGTNRDTTTDNSGFFYLDRVPAGVARITINYVGMETKFATVNVPAGGGVESEFELQLSSRSRDVVKLTAITVTADQEMSAQAIAINEQRISGSLKNVVALGEYGDRGNENIGEFLLFMPGVSIINSGNEPFGISLRGIPSEHSGIMIDGGSIAAGGADSRRVNLASVPMANISRVEITKVPTPDMPASGLGGSVNLISGSAFDKKEATGNYNVYWQFHNTTGLSLGRDRRWQLPETTAKYNMPSVDIDYTLPINSKLALTAAVTSTWRINPDQGDENGTWDLVKNVQTNANWSRITQIFKTQSAQLGAEWRLQKQTSLTANVNVRRYQRPTTRTALTLSYGAGATGDASHTQGAAAGVGNIQNGINWRVDNIDTDQASLKFRHRGNNWGFDALASWSDSLQSQDDVSRGFFNNAYAQLNNLVIRGDGRPATDGLIPRRTTAVDRAGRIVDMYNGNNYSLVSGTSGEYQRLGDVKQVRMDLTRDLDRRVPVTFKAGISINQETRDKRENLRTWNFRPNGASDDASRRAGLFDVFDEEFLADPPKMFGVPYRVHSHKKFYDLYRSRPDWFVLNETLQHQDFVRRSTEYTETVSAGYLRGDVRLLNQRLWLITGVRYEATRGEGRGPLDDISAQYLRDAKGGFVRDAAGKPVNVTSDKLALEKLRFKERGSKSGASYGSFYPSFNSTFELSDKLVLRASYARTIGRPNLNFITPGITISERDAANPTITVNNPKLKPWTANNFDLALESYNYKDGVGSVSVFSKDIQDFFGGTSFNATPELLALYGLGGGDDYSNYLVKSVKNIGNARVSGLEFGYRQSLTFLPDWARGLQIYFNATRLKVKGSKESDFSGFSPASYSGGINFIRARYYIKANISYRAETSTSLVSESATIPANTYNYSGEITRLGISAQYNLNKRLSVYLNMPDLIAIDKEELRYAPGTPKFAKGTRFQNLGYYTTLGLKGTF